MLRALPVLALLLASGCKGEDPDAETPETPEIAGVEVPPAPLARLSVDDYERTLRVIFGDDAIDAVQPQIDALPQDAPEGEGLFSRDDQRTSQRHIDQHYAIADALARASAGDGALRVRLGGACETVDDACLQPFATALLDKVLRRPPTDAEVSALLAPVGEFDGTDRVHAIVFLALMKPELVYHLENQGSDEDGMVALTGYELASRLSYHFWGEPPDAELLDAAADGSLLTDEGLRAQVDRLFDDPRTELTLREFFEEWLHLRRGDFLPGPRHDRLSGGMDTTGLSAEMREETHALLYHAIYAEPHTWSDVLLTRESFARSDRLASLYGVDAWDGSGARPQLPPAERAGLLTRAGVLATSDGSTNPFRRGAFIRRLVLCEHVNPPPGNLPPDALVPPETTASTSTRDAFAAKVEGAQCRDCHAQFSALGYAMESYDGFGRFRTREQLVDSAGRDLGFVDVDAAVTTRIDGEEVALAGGVALSEQIAGSEDARQCLARQYFRFAHRRVETGADAGLIGHWSDALADGEPMGPWLRRIALHASFRYRAIEE